MCQRLIAAALTHPGICTIYALEELNGLEAACDDHAGEDVVGVALVVDDQHVARHGLRPCDEAVGSRCGTLA